jgi:hypothetical protein
MLVRRSCRARQQRSREDDGDRPPLSTRHEEMLRKTRPVPLFSALWHDFEPLWCLLGLSIAIAGIGLGLSSERHIAGVAAIAAGPALLAAAAALIVAAARGHSTALMGLIVLAACDLGWYGMSRGLYPRSATSENYLASTPTPPGAPQQRVLSSLLRVDQAGHRVGDAMTVAGWRRADGYAGLEPQRRLDYGLLNALRVAGVGWVKMNPSTDKIAGLKPADGHWRQVRDPLPRVRLVTQTRASRDPAADIAGIRPETTALCEVPLDLPPSRPGTALLKAERPGRLDVEVHCPARQLLVVAERFHPGWHAVMDGVPCSVYRVNGEFMGCVTEAGQHRIVLAFQPESLERGRLTSCIGLAFVPLLVLGRRNKLIVRLPKDEQV